MLNVEYIVMLARRVESHSTSIGLTATCVAKLLVINNKLIKTSTMYSTLLYHGPAMSQLSQFPPLSTLNEYMKGTAGKSEGLENSAHMSIAS